MSDEDETERTKKCWKCGEVKPFNAFGKCKSKKIGVQSWCKACHKTYERGWREAKSIEPTGEPKECGKCKVVSLDFYRDKSNSDGLQDWCISCHIQYRDDNHETVFAQMKAGGERWYKANKLISVYKNILKRSAKYPEPCITFEEYIELRAATNCPVCGILMCDKPGEGKLNDTKTIDRLDSSIGYALSNCTCICYRCNSVKSIGTIEDHKRIAEWMRKRLAVSPDLRNFSPPKEIIDLAARIRRENEN